MFLMCLMVSENKMFKGLFSMIESMVILDPRVRQVWTQCLDKHDFCRGLLDIAS